MLCVAPEKNFEKGVDPLRIMRRKILITCLSMCYLFASVSAHDLFRT